MKISDIGGEFALIERLTAGKNKQDKKVIVGIGDDCAVLHHTKNSYLLFTTDMMVENDHFSLKWSTPKQIGMKIMECNVSDIVSMGGTPTYVLLSMSIRKDTSVEFMEEFYEGLYQSADFHGVALIGGDSTHGTEYVFNIAMLGDVEKQFLRLRSGAKVGDLICVTGTLGGSTAGLKLLLKGQSGYTKDHLEPKARTAKEGKTIARYAHAMIDVSDGLASEVRHICKQSNVGARIDFEKIPLSENTIESARVLGFDPYDFALYGGEDFQLVFTIKPENIAKLKEEFSDFTVVGEVLGKEQGLYMLKNGKKTEIGRGYDHFA